MRDTSVVDGLDVMRAELSLSEIMRLIEATARWVSRDTFKTLPVWYPEHARKAKFFKSNWSEPQTNKNQTSGEVMDKVEGNVHANEALTRALGLTKKQRPNWSCCHIWGGDDLTYQSSNLVVQDPRYFSCVANMVLLPSPLKAFTDSMIEVKTMLRICAKFSFDWECEHSEAEDARRLVSEFSDWDAYPDSWPDRLGARSPKGSVELTDKIEASINKRKSAIAKDLKSAGNYYPRDSVKNTLKFWNIELGANQSSIPVP